MMESCLHRIKCKKWDKNTEAVDPRVIWNTHKLISMTRWNSDPVIGWKPQKERAAYTAPKQNKRMGGSNRNPNWDGNIYQAISPFNVTIFLPNVGI